MTFSSLVADYGPGAAAGLIFSILPFVLGLRTRQKVLASLSPVICIASGIFGAFLGALASSLVLTLVINSRGRLISDNERKVNVQRILESVEANRKARDNDPANLLRQSEQILFITAKNSTAAPFATMLYERLTAKGYKVYTDNFSLTDEVRTLGVDTALDRATDVVAILTPDCLTPVKKLDSKGDANLQGELSYAIAQEKNIITVNMPGFEWPDALPSELSPLPYMNGVLANTQHLDAVLERIINCLRKSIPDEDPIETLAEPDGPEEPVGASS